MLNRLFRDRMSQDGFDMEASEMAVRHVMHQCGALILDKVLNLENGESVGVDCRCGGRFVSKQNHSKTIHTVLGKLQIKRSYQSCNVCGCHRFPADIVLDVVKTGFSPGLRRMMAKTGSMVCFEKARDMISDLAGVEITAKDVERIAEAIGQDITEKEEVEISEVMAGRQEGSEENPEVLYIATDGTSVPVLRREVKGRHGKAADGIARTRECKLGAVFSQSDIATSPVRDTHSTTYVGKIESVDQFAPRLYAEAQRRGVEEASTVVILGDGAPWIWNLAEEHFPEAIQILDFYHAQEYLGDLSKILFSDIEAQQNWRQPLSDLLWEGCVREVIIRLNRMNVTGKKKEAVDSTVGYFEKNISRMDYAECRKRNLFIGSGVVEAGCKSLIGQRLKQSGMHWSIAGSNSIIALRCCIESNKFEDYWESRKAA